MPFFLHLSTCLPFASCPLLHPSLQLLIPFILYPINPLPSIPFLSFALTFYSLVSPPLLSFYPPPPPELTFWFYVKEHLNRHELQRFYSLRQISSELGRGRAWLRCALNEHSLERYLHTLLADRPRLGLVKCVCVWFMHLFHYSSVNFTCTVILCTAGITSGCPLLLWSEMFVHLSAFLELIMKTGLLFSMKREQVCSPPWLQVSLCFDVMIIAE